MDSPSTPVSQNAAPGCFLELRLRLLGRPAKDLALIFDAKQRRGLLVVGDLFLEPLHHPAVTCPPRVFLPTEEIDHQVPGDAKQPPPKRTPVGIGIEAIDRLADGGEDFLCQILSVGMLQLLGACQAVDQRLVNRHQLAPRFIMRRCAEPQDQRSSRLRTLHGLSPCQLHTAISEMFQRSTEFYVTIGELSVIHV